MIIVGTFIGACVKCHALVVVCDNGRSDWDMHCHCEDGGWRCGGLEVEFTGELRAVCQAAHALGGKAAVQEIIRERGASIQWPPASPLA